MIDATVCVVDNGLFTELAIRLARDFKRVLYSVQWEAEFPLFSDRILGDGMASIERIEDPYLMSVVDEVDIYVFPDIFHAGKQEMLEALGKQVWGSRQGDSLETDRIRFRKLQEKLGMAVPDYTVVTGLKNLREFLKEHGERCFVKTSSKIRGTMETWEQKDFIQSIPTLDRLAVRLGGFQDYVTFMVEEPIDSDFETGFDTYCIDGQFPRTPMQGIEIKGKAILVSTQQQSRTPEDLDGAMTALSPVLDQKRYRNFLSAEFRNGILTDPCCRCPNPGIGVEMEMINNLGTIIEHGSRGELIEPEYGAAFGIQVAIFHDHDEELWKQFKLPEDVRRWIKLTELAETDELVHIVPRLPHGQKIGWLLGLGNTIEAACEHLYENAKQLDEDFPFDIKLDSVVEAVSQAKMLEKQGDQFSDVDIPEPESIAP